MKLHHFHYIWLFTSIVLVAVSACTSVAESSTPEPFTTPTTSQLGSSTLTPEPTAFPTQTATVMPTVPPNTPEAIISSLDWESDRPTVLIVTNSDDPTLVTIVDLETKESKTVSFDDNLVDKRVTWIDEICELLVILRQDTQTVIVRADLTGKVVQEIFSRQDDDNRRISIVDAVLHPSQNQIAYPVFTAEAIASANVEVASTLKPEERQLLTERGGACVDKRDVVCAIAWSPDGNQLAYSEYDTNGVKQVYVSKPDGIERIQVTDFRDPVEIYQLQWSPDGQKIAVPYSADAQAPIFLNVISLADRQAVELPYQLRLEDEFWWLTNSELGAYVSIPEGQSVSTRAVYWIDVSTGQVLHSLVEVASPDEVIIQPKSISSGRRIGFFSSSPSGRRFFVYDPQTMTFEEQTALSSVEAVYWIPLPPSSTGSTTCAP